MMMKFITVACIMILTACAADQNVVNDLNLNGHRLKRVSGFTKSDNTAYNMWEGNQVSNLCVNSTNWAVIDAAARDVANTTNFSVSISNQLAGFVKKSGDTMGGALIVTQQISAISTHEPKIFALETYGSFDGACAMLHTDNMAFPGFAGATFGVYDCGVRNSIGMVNEATAGGDIDGDGQITSIVFYVNTEANSDTDLTNPGNAFNTVGNLCVKTPTQPYHSANKSYADSLIANGSTNVVWVAKSSLNSIKNGSVLSPYDNINDAVANCPDGGVVMVAPGTYWEPAITISKRISIIGVSDRADTFVYGTNSTVAFLTMGSGSPDTVLLNLKNLSIIGTNTAIGGGIIRQVSSSYGQIIMKNCTMLNCSSTYSSGSGSKGGALSCYGRASIDSCVFSNCYAYTAGGAISCHGLYMEINNSAFINCSVGTDAGCVGGAITGISTYRVSIRNCSFSGCTAQSAGAITIANAYECYFTNNIASSAGGVAWNAVSLKMCTIEGYDSTVAGGAYNGFDTGVSLLACVTNNGFVTSTASF